ncbi:poly(A)-specific ribonuclease [Saxophila tyrrhenica]|uniref:PAN2-PAN3 deadenylation complex catalytic subunit PAN2 n=1 Tax=Saxophila tyrrhenica TaxID=1690608 RepID=A0AAV9P5W7_9PEZI|nr:poly(A)-specific ribonuclease [Saxophila tyrrhenica]
MIESLVGYLVEAEEEGEPNAKEEDAKLAAHTPGTKPFRASVTAAFAARPSPHLNLISNDIETDVSQLISSMRIRRRIRKRWKQTGTRCDIPSVPLLRFSFASAARSSTCVRTIPMKTDHRTQTVRIAHPGPSPNAPPGVVTAFAFDTAQELLWTGNEYGRVTSFYGQDLQRYTSYRGHSNSAPRGAPGNAHVKQFLFCEKGVLSISSKSIHLSSRTGLTLWHLSSPDMVELRCMSFLSSSNAEIIVAGCQKPMYRIDVDKGAITDAIEQSAPVAFTMMRRARDLICASSHDGSIHLLDSKTLSVVNSWKAYAGSVNDMDARGDYLLTCGWAQQQHHGLGLERLVRVYDLKNQRSVAPVTFGQGAAFVRMHPKLSSTCIVISQSGAIQSIDVQNPDVPMMRFAQTFEAQVTGLELVPSGKGFAMTDNHCQITLWGSSTKMQFTEFSRPTEFEDTPASTKHLDWSTADIPLNMVGMPYYREALFSGLPNSLVHEVGAPPAKWDPAFLSSLRKFEHGMVGPNPRTSRRYEVQNTRSINGMQHSIIAPKFLSEQRKDEEGQYEVDRRLSEDVNKTLGMLTLTSGPPVYYQPQKMAYSKFGVDDFDFRYFNQTRFSGLEIHIVNSYANPLLQLFRFTNVIRNLALQHTALDCRLENCMLCETGFVVDMLEKAQGLICQATNFFKALSKQNNAAGLAILEENTFNTQLTIMMQNLTRYLLPTMDDNFRRIGVNASQLQLALGTIGRAYSVCSSCSYEDYKDQVWFSHDLTYSKPAKHNQRNVRHYFSRLLKESVERYEQHRGWCMRCQSYKAIRSRRALLRTPSVLLINAAIHTPEAKSLWSTPGFLPREIGIIVHDDQFFCYEGQDLQLHLQRRIYDITVYELTGIIADVSMTESQQSHLVSVVNVSVADPEPTKRDNWHLFNDFMVRPVSAQEALYFDARWKLPSVISYQAKGVSHHLDESWKDRIDTSVLYRSSTQPALTPSYQFRAISPLESLPNQNTHCAIDAEFVRLLREEIEMNADGKRAITRPARSGLARVSVLRGDGHEQELAFIDDYIAINEPVDDYLTQYSGLNPGDLTIGISHFTLVSLKEVYKKLWVLLNLGCKFIGHGLSSDFRTINIHVPEAQVIDTQDLFSLGERTRRKLSLRFLAWLLLGEDIQQNLVAGHDSIEDARTALKLWRKYLEYEDAGLVERIKDDIYYRGKAYDFKVPVGRDGKRMPETPHASAPGTPERKPVGVARINTPARSDFGSPLR